MASLFISYCRREAPFVDSFLRELENRGLEVWLDYHTLIPGRPWQEQIYAALVATETVLLVVSKEAIESENVEWEWRQAIALKKRIILIIFEAVKLPPELEHYEWVDLRGKLKRGIKELIKRLETPIKQNSAPPQKGFKVSETVIGAIVVSLIVSLLSLLTLWTIYIPYYLFPLPYRILKRDFDFFHVRNALLLLPFASLWTGVVVSAWSAELIQSAWSDRFAQGGMGVTEVRFMTVGFVVTISFTPLLLLLLYSLDMQRWGKPIASRPKFANPYNPKIRHPKPTSFTLDFAQEDKKYADAIIHCLKRYGHMYVAKNTVEAQSAEAVLVLISAFKSSSIFSPEEYVVYPILLQDCETIDPALQRIQWIDFRRGLRNLNNLAQLLPEPTRLLKALGIVPMSNQTVLPLIIQIILFYLTVLALVSIGGWSILLLQIWQLLSFSEAILIGILLAIFLKFIFSTIQSLTSRKGRLASLPNLVGALVLIGGLMLAQTTILSMIDFRSEHPALWGWIAYFACLTTYVVGVPLIGLLGGWHWRALRRWLPQR